MLLCYFIVSIICKFNLGINEVGILLIMSLSILVKCIVLILPVIIYEKILSHICI